MLIYACIYVFVLTVIMLFDDSIGDVIYGSGFSIYIKCWRLLFCKFDG